MKAVEARREMAFRKALNVEIAAKQLRELCCMYKSANEVIDEEETSNMRRIARQLMRDIEDTVHLILD